MAKNVTSFSTVSVYKRTNHEPLRTTLAPSSLFRVGKIIIYINTDYHKLHFQTISITFDNYSENEKKQ